MRGTLYAPVERVGYVGLIPTYAGNTYIRVGVKGYGGAHPHVCGEHVAQCRRVSFRRGSSPRMRGTLYGAWEPAPAPGAHPHVCGEHSARSSTSTFTGGSSPRMRGTLEAFHGAVPSFGLIPTYAGNTETPVSQDGDSRAHPHVCGEHLIFFSKVCRFLGSSPRMRGTHSDRPVSPVWSGAHPHVCGEHRALNAALRSAQGSSPRMRGTRCLRLL